MNGRFIRWLAFLFGLFHIYTNVFASLSELWFAAVHFGGFGALCALSFHKPADYEPGRRVANSFRVLLALSAVSVAAYLILFENALYARETDFIASDYVFSALAVLLAMEFTRRTSGWFMPLLIALSLSYMLFLGRYVSGVFAFPGLSLETVLFRSYFSSTGMFGFIANISATYIFMFILFGSFLLKSGAGDFIVKVAYSVAGRYTGGAGLVAITGSGMMGSVTGSAVANTVSTGVITIPLMTRAGFRPQFSAAVEAAASTGGQLMPPVMGAGAFVIASYTQLPYAQIIAVSVLPAILYFLTVAFFVRGEARRLQLRRVHDHGDSGIGAVLRGGWQFLVPLAVLVGLLSVGYTPIRSVTFAILTLIAASWLSAAPMTARRSFDAVVEAMRTMAGTAVLLVAVGLVINVVTTTGLGNAFSLMIVEWADGNLIATLALIALASLILGMGLPVTAAYVVLATLAAPMLFDLISRDAMLEVMRSTDLSTSVQATIELFGGDPKVALQEMPLEMKQILRQELLDPLLLTGMLLSSHLVIFWFSQDSNVTPPVCLAAFAAAGIAGSRPMATGLTTWKLAKGLYLVPLLFVYTPLISGSWAQRIEIFFWATLALYALCAVLQWYLKRRLNAVTAALLLLSAAVMLWQPFGLWVQLAGAGLLLAVVGWQRYSPAPLKEGRNENDGPAAIDVGS
ncbi:MAG: TRAP transporter fused permease subunit [Woeseia sp.]